MTTLYKLTGTLQQYTWGGKDYIPNLIGFTAQKDQLYAEWWLGAHPSSPSTIKVDDKTMPLNQFLSQNPTALGQQSRSIFGDELPYLLKILDVKQPLSIQLHPTKQQAEIGFVEENVRGIDLTDPKRTYKDKNHKPEMMIALSDFWLLHGFKPKTEILKTLRERSSLQTLANQLETQDLHHFYSDIMQANQTQLASWLLPIFEHNRLEDLSPENPDYWVLYSQKEMNISLAQLDAGLMCFYLFNIVQIKQGQGIFQDAGIPHAYLRGQNIELMACSDNVIRGGLTSKHVNIDELLKVIDCREVIPELIKAAPPDNGSFTYTTPAKDFALENVRYDDTAQINGKAESATILLVMQGCLKISDKNTALELKQGESAFICADTAYQISGRQVGYCVLAKLP
ncbi:mannose-6-phosphate isomerase, class I [Lonepinella koalarum]|uniref:mannose-6-phosphate isomerase n=1 Tax=Lonepinella koalarum TaxID=53417 RepID=A0A4R1KJH7_9PAST|nr:mannose-6-phosphate isomerase, class I [Lonepinella koalarum]MDH2927400.1 mannose-6-phosphate isomerase [Lonepinella koalarum]TCK64968.1 mannose-6-phosphate isomerase type 1 [Lonepinella koalarum]TFJ88864.1 mannose-6-phosphate isomerase, class I [Lonepinella koalarum]